jgi:PDZ domain-containing secreted protein
MTNRLMEVIYSGCIPVSIGADYIQLPFTDMINFDKVIIWIDEDRISDLSKILESISEEEIVKRQKILREIANEGTNWNGGDSDALQYFMLEMAGFAMNIGVI